jgi:hypothetical protein
LKERPADRMLERNPAQILRKAVTGMLKRNKLRHAFIEPRLPAKLHGKYHFGLQQYAHPNSYQYGGAAGDRKN